MARKRNFQLHKGYSVPFTHVGTYKTKLEAIHKAHMEWGRGLSPKKYRVTKSKAGYDVWIN